MTTPPNTPPDVAQIARELRAGMEGVTPGWELAEPLSGNVRKDGGYSLISMPNSDITAFREIANFGPHKADAWHAWGCSPDRIIVLLNALDAQTREIAELREALDKSVELQSFQAALLNQYDGGNRRGFASGQAWLDRLAELRARSALRAKENPNG